METYGQGTHSTEYQNGYWYIGRKYTKCPPKFWPNLSAQAQKFGILEKLGVRSPWFDMNETLSFANQIGAS